MTGKRRLRDQFYRTDMNIFGVIPAVAGIQKPLNSLDSGPRPALRGSSGMTAFGDCGTDFEGGHLQVLE